MNLLKRLAMNGMLFGAVLVIQPLVASAQPQLSIQSERAAHPRMVAAVNEMTKALREMEAAPDDFGGNKAAAIADTQKALHSLKRALYFRLKMDDAAIDRVQ